MQIIHNLFRAAVTLGAFLFAGIGHAADPTSLIVTLYKTELYNGSSWVTIYDNAAGNSVDLVTDSGSILGSANIPDGIYDRLRMTIGNTITFSGINTSCTGNQIADNQISTIGTAAQVPLVFATAVTGGQTSLYADASESRPLLMTAPVEVVRGRTTEVNLTFNTAGTLVCDYLGNVEQAPVTISVISVLRGNAYAFNGGDYWIASNHLYAAGLHDLVTGEYIEPIDPATGASNYEPLFAGAEGDTYRAQWRSNSAYEVGWGFKVRLSAPDANGHGTVYTLRDGGWHRHQLDESWCQALTGGCAAQSLGVTAAATSDLALPAVIGSYTIGADNRLYLTGTDGASMVGALSQDYSVLTIGDLANRNRASLMMGMHVSTTSPTLPVNSGLMSNISYGLDFNRYTEAAATASSPYGVTLYARHAMNLGWTYFDMGLSTNEVSTYDSFSRWDNPIKTPLDGFSATIGEDNYYRLDTLFTMPSINADGTITSPGDWSVFSAGFGVYLDVRGTSDLDPTWSTITEERHGLGIGIGLFQATPGTFTVADIAGRYLVTGIWDNVNSGAPINGTSVGVITFETDGSFMLQESNRDTYGRIEAMNLAGTYTVAVRCYGINQTARDASMRLNDNLSLDPNADRLILADPFNRLAPALSENSCAYEGGHSLDTIVLSDEFGTEIVHMFVSSDGNVLSYHDPLAFSDASGRSLGIAVRLN